MEKIRLEADIWGKLDPVDKQIEEMIKIDAIFDEKTESMIHLVNIERMKGTEMGECNIEAELEVGAKDSVEDNDRFF